MSASELIPTVIKPIEYSEQTGVQPGKDSVYLQMLEQMRLTELKLNDSIAIRRKRDGTD